jgi:two-component system response regulator DevR
MTTPPTIKLGLVEDHAIVRKGLEELLRTQGFEVVGEWGTVEEALPGCREAVPDVLVLDLNLPATGIQGLDAIRMIRECQPSVHIVVYTFRENIPTVGAAYKAGASAYVPKSADLSVLLDAIRKAAKGERFYPGAIAARLGEFYTTERRDPRECLTATDLEIFKGAAEGKTPEELGAQLHLAAKTIKNRLAEIQRSLQCERADFYRIAVEYGILQLKI